MAESLGARLRRQREDQGIALPTIAEGTKIKASLLEALERDDVSRWPSGIFRRAYIRAYAQAIGLDADAVVREFLEVHGDPGEDLAAAAVALTEAQAAGRSSAPPTRLRYIVGSALESLGRLRRGAPGTAPVDGGGSRPQPPPAEDLEWDDAGDGVAERGESDGQEREEPARNVHPAPLEQGQPSPAPVQGRASEMSRLADGTTAEDEPRVERQPVRPVAEDAAPAVTEPPPVPAATTLAPAPRYPDLSALARLCGELARVETAARLQPLLHDAARILEAAGIVVWVWDVTTLELRAALAHGYSDRVLAQLPAVGHDADNATAQAFRTGRMCVIRSSDGMSGALVVPLPTPQGSAGVLAIELQDGREQVEPIQAAATIVAAALGQLAAAPAREVPSYPDAPAAPVVTFARQGVRRVRT